MMVEPHPVPTWGELADWLRYYGGVTDQDAARVLADLLLRQYVIFRRNPTPIV